MFKSKIRGIPVVTSRLECSSHSIFEWAKFMNLRSALKLENRWIVVHAGVFSFALKSLLWIRTDLGFDFSKICRLATLLLLNDIDTGFTKFKPFKTR